MFFTNNACSSPRHMPCPLDNGKVQHSVKSCGDTPEVVDPCRISRLSGVHRTCRHRGWRRKCIWYRLQQNTHTTVIAGIMQNLTRLEGQSFSRLGDSVDRPALRRQSRIATKCQTRETLMTTRRSVPHRDTETSDPEHRHFFQKSSSRRIRRKTRHWHWWRLCGGPLAAVANEGVKFDLWRFRFNLESQITCRGIKSARSL